MIQRLRSDSTDVGGRFHEVNEDMLLPNTTYFLKWLIREYSRNIGE